MNTIKHTYSEFFSVYGPSFDSFSSKEHHIRAYQSPKKTKDGSYLVHVYFLYSLDYFFSKYLSLGSRFQIPIGTFKVQTISKNSQYQGYEEEIEALVDNAEKTHKIFKAILRYTFEGVVP